MLGKGRQEDLQDALASPAELGSSGPREKPCVKHQDGWHLRKTSDLYTGSGGIDLDWEGGRKKKREGKSGEEIIL